MNVRHLIPAGPAIQRCAALTATLLACGVCAGGAAAGRAVPAPAGSTHRHPASGTWHMSDGHSQGEGNGYAYGRRHHGGQNGNGDGEDGGSGSGSTGSGSSGSTGSGTGSTGTGSTGTGSTGSTGAPGTGTGATGPGAGSSAGSEGSPLPAPVAPVAGSSATVAPNSGSVNVELPGSNQFVPLSSAAQIPMGTVIDATAGKVALTSAVSASGETKTGVFSGGDFVVTQTHGPRPLTDLRLLDAPRTLCAPVVPAVAPGEAPLAVAASARRRVLGALWGGDHGGHFRTIGHGASATVRGTVWLTQDRCDGTLVRVMRGAVLVHDFARHRTVVVRAGHSYLARVRH